MVDDAVNEIKASLGDNCTLIQLYGQLHSEADNAFHEIVDNLSVDCSADVEIMGAIAGECFEVYCTLLWTRNDVLIDVHVCVADKVDYVLKCIRDENENKPVIFIFNEFHLFCDEGENTLIYPMIDVLHSKVVWTVQFWRWNALTNQNGLSLIIVMIIFNWLLKIWIHV